MVESSSDSGECCVARDVSDTSGGATTEESSAALLDLDSLEAETLSILHKYGSPGAKSLRRIGPPVAPPSRRSDKLRPWTGASVLNRPCRTTGGIVKRNTVAGSRPLASASRKHALRDAAASALNQPGSAPQYTKPSDLVGGQHMSEWDSVPSLLASGKTNEYPSNQSPPRTSPFLREPSPYSVSLLGGASKVPTPKRTAPARLQVPSEGKFDPNKLESLALRDIKYSGFDKGSDFGATASNGDQAKDSVQSGKEVCFTCWSAGQGDQCTIHANASPSLPSDSGQSNHTSSLSLCSNWGTGLLRRKYRSEEIHEQLAQTSQSLVFDNTQKEFAALEQPKHPIYRLVSQHIASLNFTNQRRQHVQTWFRSFLKRLKDGKYQSKRSEASAQILLLRSTVKGMTAVRKLSKEVKDQHPQAPVTGTTIRERLGQEQVLVERQLVGISGAEEKRSFVLAGPAPVPKALYRARQYEPLPPAAIVLKDEAETSDERLDFSSILSRSVTYATFSSKRTKENVAVGGLSAEVIVSRRFTGRFPPQYKNFTCNHDVVLVPPSVDEESTSFPTLVVPPGKLPYIRHDLVTPLDSRLPPTVMVKTGLSPEDRHFFGLNRPEQTGEEGDFGFRTSTWCEMPVIDGTIDTTTFCPSQSVATPNVPVLSPMRKMKVDLTYPFRKEQSRTNSVDDLFHFLLSDGACSSNKLQVFTCIGSQQCGYFMQNGDSSLPIGRMATKVVRSWAFLQSDSEEKAVYEEEQVRLGEGGVLLKHRPRHAESMPGGVLTNNSRSEAREAILRKMPEEDDSLERTIPQALSHECKPAAEVPAAQVPRVTTMGPRSPISSGEISSKSPSIHIRSASGQSLRSDSSKPEPTQISAASPTQSTRKESTVVADSISHVIGETLKSFSAGSPEDLIRLGMGIGASLGAQGFLNLESAEPGNAANHSACSEEASAAPENDAENDVTLPELDLHGMEDITIQSCISEESKLDCFPTDGHNLEDAIVNYSDLHPSPDGLLDEVAAKRVGRKRVEYLPFTFRLSLPTHRTTETCKPRSMAEEWKEEDYNPWTVGRDPTSSTFIRSLTQETKKWPVQQRKEGPINNSAAQLKTLFTLCRHGKYRELEETINNPSWTLPIDYCDDSGNTLLHIAVQNGNKRMAKLCLRRGSQINSQNLNGNSCLHFAFGYGFGDLGEYLISKGADDSRKNGAGLTPYEFGVDSELE